MSGTEGDAIAEPGAEHTHGAAWRTIMLVVMALLGLSVLVGLIFTLSGANRQRDEAQQRERHSYEVMILARTLAGTIADAEAALGRYVISGDRALGGRYAERWQVAGAQIAKLRRDTADNPEQAGPIAQLADAYDARGAELDLIALSTRYKKNTQALGLYYRAGTSPRLARITALLNEISRREHVLLDQRTTSAMAAVAHSNDVAKVLTVFGLFIVIGSIVLGWVMVQALGFEAIAQAETAAERERAEDLQAAVAAATAELRTQEAQLRQIQKMEAIGQLTGGIAHDFNNMLAVVLGGLELARRQIALDPAAASRHIDSATEGAKRAAELTRRLLAFSREDALHTEPVEPGALVAGMSDLLDRTLGDAVTVTVRDAGSGWHTRIDKHQLENVILNLAVNARDAMDGRGQLTITTAGTALSHGAVGACPAGEYVSIAVSDTGSGMTPEVMERVFEPFFTTKPVGKGTGLGLSQVFSFVRQAEGEVALRSAPGEGTTVTLYLPRHTGDTAPVATPLSLSADVAPAALDILVVEDDPRVLAATMGALEELGHRAVACGDPLAAPALLAANQATTLVISDVLMPGQTGPEMVAGLLLRRPDVAVLFVTGFAGEACEAEFGGHVVLRKPFTIAGLEAAIHEAVATRGVTEGHIAAE
ncbi:kinase [Sphingomonas panacis]|uniref:histidine kinase n=1 Tax=Sphingomonas panacis TaxID=1560345 RepID=A0A1B3Z9A7_9SPHN|nr:ATP-binding protein [Sphingomonas panacis]AOH84013.1 kinase [Sphingomonas panacis]